MLRLTHDCASSIVQGQERPPIHLTFEPFAIAGSGPTVTGQMLRIEEIMIPKDADHDPAEKHFMMADGSGKQWLAYQHEYVRRRTDTA